MGGGRQGARTVGVLSCGERDRESEREREDQRYMRRWNSKVCVLVGKIYCVHEVRGGGRVRQRVTWRAWLRGGRNDGQFFG